VWLLVGVNGVGKTTTAAKLAEQHRADGQKVLLVAADTFRAAAVEQLEAWGATLGVEVLRGQEGGDPASVVFDAVQRAQAHHVDLVLVDTAGRLHTKRNLMEELKKVRRIVERFPGALAEVLLVLDATTGQNGLTQAREFLAAVDVTGVVLTKLDGTAKGGIVLAVESELGVPVKLIGVGERADDLLPFHPDQFAAALIG
jgi:fused signal recognition particle receptor